MVDLSGAKADAHHGGRPATQAGGGILGALAREQLAALAALRWRMFRNGLRSINGVLDLGATGIALVLFSLLGLGLGLGLGAVSYGIASDGSWKYLPILFWGVCFVWQIIPVMLASYQEQFDLNILLRFPVRFDSFYLMYLLFGFMDASTILGFLSCFGVWIGISIVRPELSFGTALALLVFAAFNILLVRAVFAWIERWLAQRKTREILGAAFMAAILGLQLLNPAIYHKRTGRSQAQSQVEQLSAVKTKYSRWLRQANAVQRWLPPGLAAHAVSQAAQKELVSGMPDLGILGIYALFAGAVLGMRLKGEYGGENLGTAPRRERVSGSRKLDTSKAGLQQPSAFDRGATSMPGAAGPIAAVIEKEARALLRTLPLLYAIGAPMLMVVVFSSIFIHNGGAQASVFPFALPVCMVYAQLGFTQVFYNNLGAEGAGVQFYFFSPTPIRTVLLAKNLFHSALFIVAASVAGVLAGLRVGIPSDAVIAATAAWLLFALPCNLAAGNVISIKMAYRVNPGRIGRSKGSQGNSLLSLLLQIGFLAVGAAVFALCWSLHRMALATPIFLVLAAGAVFVWWQVLKNGDALANERKVELIATLMKAA